MGRETRKANPKRRIVTVSLDPSTYDRLTQAARAEHRYASDYFRHALLMALEARERETATAKAS